jgi:integrase
LWDTAVTGFGARPQTNGVFYYVRYRHNGAQIVKSIGRHGALTPDTARNKAKQLLGLVAGGYDPFAQALAGEGFATSIDRYLERKRASLKPNSIRETERYLRNHSAPLHRFRLDEIDRRKVAALLAQIETSSGPIARNRLRATLSAFFAWAIQEGLVETNPLQGTGKANEGSRERILTPTEIRALWAALAADPFSEVIRLLLLTGQRRVEIGKLTWSEVDREMIVLPAARTKNSRQHEVPLSRQALAMLERQPRRNATDFIFGGWGFNWTKGKAKLDRRLRIAPWTLHDLRRTCATGMAELGIQPHVIESVLNHVSGHKAGVAGIYNRSKLIEPMREALQRWADHVEAITRCSSSV